SGAPPAKPVADRFQLVKHLQAAIERTLVSRQAVLREAAREISPRDQTEQMLKAEGLMEALPDRWVTHNKKAHELSQPRPEQRLARDKAIKQLKQPGRSNRKIARRRGLHRETVRNLLRAESFPERAAATPRSTKLEPVATSLKQRWQEGCQEGAPLDREIR